MIGKKCKYSRESDFSASLIFNVKKALGKEYKFEIFKTVAEAFEGESKDITLDYILKNYPRKNLQTEEKQPVKQVQSSVTKIISGGQSGVDTIGLQVAKSLGIETGGTAPKNYERERGYDNEDISSYGLVEITEEQQRAHTAKTGKNNPYTGRTELNVINSDGTVYFFTSDDKSGYYATKKYADENGKPFLVNPTAKELRAWIERNNIKTLNVAGNRGSKLNNPDAVASVLREALTMESGRVSASTREKISKALKQYPGYWSREEVKGNPRTLYIFTDNTDRDSGSSRIPDDSWYAKKYGKGLNYPSTTTAKIRGLDNAMPISTVKWFYKKHKGVTHPKNDRSSEALWHDSDKKKFVEVITQELDAIVERFESGEYDTIMFPSGDGLFNADISDISMARTPELYQALSNLLTEYGFESLIPQTGESPKAASKPVSARIKTPTVSPNARWAVKAAPESSLEVSSAGDEFGRKFSALNAVLAEGTVVTIKVGSKKDKKEFTADVGGYSIEAAYQLLKGYERNPKGSLIDSKGNLIKVNGKTIRIDGKGEAPIRDVMKIVSYNRTSATKEMRENHSYNQAYLPLWKLWAQQNPELIQQLRERAGEDKILTDKFSGNSSVSQARALAEILWGNSSSSPVSEFNKERYAEERKQAVQASEDILKQAFKDKAVQKDRIKSIDRSSTSDEGIKNLSRGLTVHGQQMKEGEKNHPGYLIAFEVETSPLESNMNLTHFFNPFAGERDALQKFIQWIIPNDPGSLPSELYKSDDLEKKRNALRSYLEKQGFTKRTILTDGSVENRQFAYVLRYIIDNFKTLRERYNPVNIQEFANLKHKVNVTFEDASEDSADTILRFIPQEERPEEGLNDDNSVRVNRYNSNKEGEPDQYIINFPDSFDVIFSPSQQERIIKSLAAMTPEGAVVTISPDMATPQMLQAFDKVVKYGYDMVATKEVTMGDGSTEAVGIYQRRAYTYSQVEKRESYTPKSVKENYSEEPYFFIFENASIDQLENTAATIPTWHDNKRLESSYFNDDKDFEWFKGHVDRAVEKAKKAIDEGRKVVIPKDPMGSGSSALYHYAPKCYDYVNQKMQELLEYGNRGDMARDYMSSAVTTIPAITSNPGEDVNLDVSRLQNPRMVLYQKFTNTEIVDLSSYYREVFISALKKKLADLKKQYQDRIAAETDKKEKAILQHRLNKLTNPETQYLEALKETTMPEMHSAMRENMANAISLATQGKTSTISIEGVPLLETSLNTPGLFELIFNYSIPLIEDSVGIRITANQTVVEQSNENEDRLQAEDVNGEDTPEMGWSYNYRLVDPFKSLTFKVRSLISNVEMRDPNNRKFKLRDSLGRPKTYNSNYLYASIMSRMSQLTMGEIDNFVTITPVEKLKDKEAKKFPLGKPEFKILENMKYQYPWALDIVAQLTSSYNINTLKAQYPGMSVEEIQKDQTIMANLGNTVSQFYTNFCQTFVSYATMVNGRIIEENKAIGEVSLKESAITNYEGNVRFPGVAMIYNSDSTVNNDNIQKQLDEVRDILNVFYTYTATGGKTEKKDNPFWNEIRRLQKLVEGGKDLNTVWENDCTNERKKFINRVVNTLKASGLNFHAFDIFCLAMDNKAKSGITEMLSEYELCLKAVMGLPKGEHIFESSKTTEYQETWTKDKLEYHTPRFYWNKFFEKFGDRVTETELVDSTRILGKSRYSYIYPSYSSMTMENLTNPDLEARKKYIKANYMPYDWFYNKRTGKFKNRMLEDLYNGAPCKSPSQRRYGKGHDMIVKKDGYEETEYQDWSPEDILQLMLQEQNQPTDTTAACYLYPVLSDSQVCKVVQAPKIEIKEAREGMRDVVLQELERMEIVENRNIILNMQDYDDQIKDGVVLDSDSRKYYDRYLEYYTRYKERHPERLENIENFDKNGEKFCFFPELNRYKYSRDWAVKTENSMMLQTIMILSADPRNPVSNTMSLKQVLRDLQNMTDSTFAEKAAAIGMVMHRSDRKYVAPEEVSLYNGRVVPITREVLINSIIEEALGDVMEKKIADFMYKRMPSETSPGELNDYVLEAVTKTDSSLMAKRNSLPRETENYKLSPEEIEKVNEFNDLVKEKISKFYYAHTYTMSQFLQLMVTDIAFYKNPDSFEGSVDFGKRFKEVAGAGMKLNTNSKFGKKIECSIILKDSVRRSASMNTLDQVLQRAVDEERITEYEKDAILEHFKGIKGTDAQAYRSLTSWRDVMDMIGKNDSNIARAIENLRNNKWSMSDFYTVFQTIKPFTFGPEDQDSGIGDTRMRVMVQHKNSEAVLLALYNTLVGSAEGDANYSPRLRGLNRAMEEIKLTDENGNVMKYVNGEEMRAIDVAQYQSAVKVGAQGLVDINWSRKKLKELQGTTIKVEGKNFKIGERETYYSIAERLGRAADAKAISEEEYNRVMDMLEPDENEVFEIIKQAIYKNGDESLGYNNQVLHRIPYAYYSIQQPTPNHYTDNTDGTFGSQPRHIVMADIPDGFTVKINGHKYNREELRERYSGLLVANLLECYEKEIEPLFDETVNKGKTVAERLRDRLKPLIENNPKYGNSLLDALEVDENGEFVMPINNLTVAHQLEEILTSLFKNAIHRQHINGGNVIIAADEGVGYSKRLKIRGKRDSEGKLTSVEGIECLLPAQAKEMLQPFMEEKTKVVEDEKGNKETITYYELSPEKLKEAGLEKAIGYRIPTEGLYSIMPLIIRGFLPQQSGSSIVLAQEVTTLTGSDNDVDKLFLMLKRATWEQATNGKKGKKKLKAIKSDPNKHPMELTKLQRDNEIIDIFYAVTTHKDMSHLWLSPGNFDNLKLEAQKSKIEKTPYLRKIFLENAGRVDDFEWLADLFEKGANEDVTDLYKEIMRKELKKDERKTMLDLVVDFTGAYQNPLSPVYPDTFIKMHQMYMAGVAEKGIYANNTLDHAKLQWTNIRLSDSSEFTFNGSRIKKIDERYVTKAKNGKKYRHYISKDCAECSAASVDNGKDPQLDDINSNKQTATFFGFLLRLGLGLDGAGALMAQPEVDFAIRTGGNINDTTLKKAISEIEAYLQNKGFDLKDSHFDWQSYNFTVRDWRMNVMTGNYRALIRSNSSAEPVIDRLTSFYCTYNLVRHLMKANQDMQNPRTVLHYDSPTHAAESELGGVVAQTKTVEELNKRSTNISERSIVGEESLVVYDLEKKFEEANAEEGKKTKSLSDWQTSEKRKLYDAIMSSQIPITQAFYTLGIEKIRSGFKKQFIFGRQEMQELTDVMWDYMDKMNIRSNETRIKIISQMFKDWTVYRLSKTKLFGTDDKLTYDQKRQYYLYQFPDEFMKLKEQIPELNSIEATRNMYVEGGIILMHRGQKTRPTLRDFITHSFDTLISSKDKRVQEVGKKLFMYTYYLNGFDFSYASFGNMMSTTFQTAFPEFVKALREMNTEPITREDMDNFFNQMLVKRNRNGLLPKISYASRTAREEGLQRGYFDTGTPYNAEDDIPEYVIDVSINGKNQVQTEVLRLNKSLSELNKHVIYQPVRSNTSFHYNADQTLDEMLDVVYDQDIIDRNRKTNLYRRSPEVAQSHNYQNSKNMKEVSTERDTNVPEPSANGTSRSKAPENANVKISDIKEKAPENAEVSKVNLNDDAESRESSPEALKVAAGVVAADDNPFSKEEKLKITPTIEKALDDTEKKIVDRHILDKAQGESIIKENNNGKTICPGE